MVSGIGFFAIKEAGTAKYSCGRKQGRWASKRRGEKWLGKKEREIFYPRPL